MRIALGTVQWGMNYGISNLNGVPSDQELSLIFKRMEEVGIDTLDTAMSYGNAEKRLRDMVSPSHKIISKVNTSILQKKYADDLMIESTLKYSYAFLNKKTVSDSYYKQLLFLVRQALKNSLSTYYYRIDLCHPLNKQRDSIYYFFY